MQLGKGDGTVCFWCRLVRLKGPDPIPPALHFSASVQGYALRVHPPRTHLASWGAVFVVVAGQNRWQTGWREWGEPSPKERRRRKTSAIQPGLSPSGQVYGPSHLARQRLSSEISIDTPLTGVSNLSLGPPPPPCPALRLTSRAGCVSRVPSCLGRSSIHPFNPATCYPLASAHPSCPTSSWLGQSSPTPLSLGLRFLDRLERAVVVWPNEPPADQMDTDGVDVSRIACLPVPCGWPLSASGLFPRTPPQPPSPQKPFSPVVRYGVRESCSDSPSFVLEGGLVAEEASHLLCTQLDRPSHSSSSSSRSSSRPRPSPIPVSIPPVPVPIPSPGLLAGDVVHDSTCSQLAGACACLECAPPAGSYWPVLPHRITGTARTGYFILTGLGIPSCPSSPSVPINTPGWLPGLACPPTEYYGMYTHVLSTNRALSIVVERFYITCLAGQIFVQTACAFGLWVQSGPAISIRAVACLPLPRARPKATDNGTSKLDLSRAKSLRATYLSSHLGVLAWAAG